MLYYPLGFFWTNYDVEEMRIRTRTYYTCIDLCAVAIVDDVDSFVY